MPRNPTPEAAEALARLIASGPLAVDDREALQLGAGVSPSQAAALIERFGSFPETLGASAAELERLAPRPQAARIVLMHDVAARLLRAPLRARPMVSGWDAVEDHLRAALAGRARAELRVLFLDGRNRLIRDEVMARGTVDHVPVYPREIVGRALELNASALVLATNHPGGLPTPSETEVEVTRQVVAAGRVLRIAVHDHYLVAGDQVASFRALGLL